MKYRDSAGPLDGVWRLCRNGNEDYADPAGPDEIPQWYNRFGFIEMGALRWLWIANHPSRYACTTGRAWTRNKAKAMVLHARLHPEQYRWS